MASLSGLLGVVKAGLLSGPEAFAVSHPFSELRTLRDAAVARLEKLQKTLPEGDGARFEHGRYILAESEERRQSSRLRRSGRQIHTANRI